MAKKIKSVSKKTGPTKTKSATAPRSASRSAPRHAPSGIGVWSAFGNPAFSTSQPSETTMSKSTSQNSSRANDSCANPFMQQMMNMMGPGASNSWMPMMGSNMTANMNSNPFMQQMMNMMNQMSSGNAPTSFQDYYAAYTRNCNDAMKHSTEACMESAKACYDYMCQAYRGYTEACQEAADTYTEACRSLSSCRTPEEYTRLQNEYAQRFYRQAQEAADTYGRAAQGTSSRKSRAA